MKAILKQEHEKFQPITMQITFETKDEFKALFDVCGWNMSVAELVRENQYDSQPFVEDTDAILGDLYNKMLDMAIQNGIK